MQVVLNTLEGTHTIDNVVDIRQFDGTLVFTCADNTEYNSANDFPTMYRFEVYPEIKK